MVEGPIHTAGEIERDVFIATPIVYSLTVLIFQLESLPTQVHLAETFSRAYEALVRGATERDGSALVACCLILCGCLAADIADGERIITWR